MDLFHLGIGYIGAGLAAGIAILGAGIGIGRLGASAMEGIARQPEAAGTIRTAMIIVAVLIEGLGFFALVVAFMMVNSLNSVISHAGH